MTFEVAGKALTYASVLLLVGTSTTVWLMHAASTPTGIEARRSLRRIGILASVCALTGLIVRAWAHTAVAFGFAESFGSSALSTILLASRWGYGWRWQLTGAVACLGAFVIATPVRLTAWLAPTVASIGFVVSLSTTGHAAGVPTRMAVHTAHVVGAGLWLGTLATLMITPFAFGPNARAQLFRAFSAVAFTGAGVLGLTGLIASGMYVDSLSALWTSSYGRVLLGKLGLVIATAGCGWVNWRAIRSGEHEPGRAGRIELLLALSIVAATALLTELQHP